MHKNIVHPVVVLLTITHALLDDGMNVLMAEQAHNAGLL